MPPTSRRPGGPSGGSRHGKPRAAPPKQAPAQPRVDLVALAATVREAVGPALQAAGFDAEAVVLRRAGSRTVVDVTVDREGPLDLDAVADASRVVETVLDADPEMVPGVYVLEVGTRGADTPLTLPRHWRRAVGRLVACTVDGAKVTGRVVDVAGGTPPDAAVVLETVDGRTVATTVDATGRAVVQLEFTHHGADELDELLDDDETDDETDGDETDGDDPDEDDPDEDEEDQP